MYYKVYMSIFFPNKAINTLKSTIIIKIFEIIDCDQYKIDT